MTLGEHVGRLIGEPVEAARPVAGGDIGRCARVRTGTGVDLFVKTVDRDLAGMFEVEAAGLEALGRVDGGCRVPRVVAVGGDPPMIVLEWIERGRAGTATWEAFGRGLAAQHRVTRAACGFDAGDGFIGRTPQPNPDEPDLVAFFRDHRIVWQHALLRDKGRSTPRLDRLLDRFRDRMDSLLRVSGERPALLHGDLWGGNMMPGPGGEAVIFDPAAHFACREADVAMTELFGGFDSRWRDAYEEVFPLAPGFDARRDLYNVYHLLNHANLFGGGYAAQVEWILAGRLGDVR